MIPKNIAITYTDPSRGVDALKLAKRLNLSLTNSHTIKDLAIYDYVLIYTAHYLGLQKRHDPHPLRIDFLSGAMRFRSKNAGLRNEFLARAIGIRPQLKPKIVDATAGLGRDSFILARLGYEVTLIEKSPIIHALLEDALLRASNNQETANIVKRLTLINMDSLDWLKQKVEEPKEARPDIIYLDPMYPKRQKAASASKEMTYLQDLLGPDNQFETLLELALTCATRRVVIKRPRLASNYTERAPSFPILGKSSRFDIYLV